MIRTGLGALWLGLWACPAPTWAAEPGPAPGSASDRASIETETATAAQPGSTPSFSAAPDPSSADFSAESSTTAVPRAPRPGPTPPVPGLNTDERRERAPGVEPLQLLLRLPEAFVEVALTPLLITVWALETYDVAERVLDVITNPERTAVFLPIIQPFGDSGIGFGGLLAWNAPLGGPDRLVLLALADLNEDWTVSVDFGRRLPFVSGRELSTGVSASVDNDTRYYGFGSESREGDLRLLRRETIDLTTSITLISPAAPVLRAEAGLAYRRRALEVGSGGFAPPIDPDAPSDPELPPGFGLRLDYPEASAEFGVDTRDSFGLTSRGIVWNLAAAITHEINGGDLGGIRSITEVAAFVPLLPRDRTLFVRLGAGASFPFRPEDSVPYHFLMRLGGNNTLRGYNDERFVDELAWWGTVEYRWFFYEWAGTGGGLVSTVFFDVGQVGRDVDDLFEGNLPWSTGFSIRVEQSLIMLGRLQVGFSPEGVQVSFAIGDLL